MTLNAVATALEIPIRSGKVRVEGDLDFRGTLGVAKDAPVGFKDIRLRFELDSDATEDQLATLIKLTERYCVVYQTLRNPPGRGGEGGRGGEVSRGLTTGIKNLKKNGGKGVEVSVRGARGGPGWRNE